MRNLADLPGRLVARIELEPMSGCWLWTGVTNPEGYGRTWWEGRKQPTHRVVYQLMDRPIPDGLQIDHLCRNRACCSPWHLEPVTCRVNIRRGNARFNGRTNNANAAKTHCPRGHAYTPENTHTNGRGHRHCRVCRRVESKRGRTDS